MTLQIAPAARGDLPAILALYAQPEIDDGKVMTLGSAEALFDRMAAYPDYAFYVARSANAVVGVFAMLVMENLGHCGSRSAIVEGVAVAPEAQGQGIGQAMMRWACEAAHAKGCYKLALSSNLKRDRAHKFYDQLGFERHGYSFSIRLDNKEVAA